MSKHPPHQGKYEIAADIGPLRMATLPTYHVDGTRFVTGAQHYFREQRVPHASIPASAQEEDIFAYRETDGSIMVRPLFSSGIRHASLVVRDVCALLEDHL